MALYRFKDPAVPGIVLPLAQPFSSGDLQLNEENPIVELDGSDVDNACNGDQASFLPTSPPSVATATHTGKLLRCLFYVCLFVVAIHMFHVIFAVCSHGDKTGDTQRKRKKIIRSGNLLLLLK